MIANKFILFFIIVIFSISTVVAFPAICDTSEVIIDGTYTYESSENMECYRIWIDKEGSELKIDIGQHHKLYAWADSPISLYDPGKNKILQEYFENLETHGITAERGWYYIYSQNFIMTVSTYPPDLNKFRMSELSITPPNTYLGEEIVISFDVINTGQFSDTCTAELIVDGILIDSKDVSISGGGTQTILFNKIVDVEGMHNVEIVVSPTWTSTNNKISGSYTVLHIPSPNFEVNNLAIEPEIVDIGNNIRISVDVTNTGDADGTYQVKLKLDNYIEDSKTVALVSGEAKSIEFIIAKNFAGSYDVDIDTLSGSFTVVSTSPTPIYVTPTATSTPKYTVAPTATSTQTSSVAPLTITPTPIPTSISIPSSSASISLHGEKTDVIMGEDILLKLSAVNLITKPKMHVQVIIIPPSGMSVTSSEFSKVAAGQFTTYYELEQGGGRDIEVRIKSNQLGDFDVKGRIIFYFEDEKDKAEDYTLTLPIKVREEINSLKSIEKSSSVNSLQESIPGFGTIIGFCGLLFAILVKKRN